MKNSELFSLFDGIEACSGLKGVKFSYALAKNKKILSSEIEVLRDTVKPSKEIVEFEQKRIALAIENSEKDEHGQAKVEGDRYVIVDQKKFNSLMEELKKGYTEALAEESEKQKIYDDLMKEESSVKLFTIEKENVPDDISVGQMSGILPIINDQEL